MNFESVIEPSPTVRSAGRTKTPASSSRPATGPGEGSRGRGREPEVEPPQDGEPVALHRYKISAHKLKKGMFVAELDRPWLDTPFLVQGFKILNEDELKSLNRHCRYAFVDLDKSDKSVVAAIREAAQWEMPAQETRSIREGFRSLTGKAGGPTKPQSGRRTSSTGRQRLTAFLDQSVPGHALKQRSDSLFGRLMSFVDDLFTSKPDPKLALARKKAHRDQLQKLLPPDMKLRRYADQVTVEEELPRARDTFKRSEESLESLVRDVRSGRLPSIENIQEVVDDIVHSMIDNPDAMMWVAKMRDQDATTYGHAVKVALYMIALGRHLGFPRSELSSLGMIGLLADVGKTKLPRDLLEKPGMLSGKEYAVVKEHVRLGLEALREDQLPTTVIDGIAQHHERLDGSGYPKGLKDEEISIYGRMAAITDTFAAMITPRAYANAVSPHDAILNLFEWSGSSFHEPLVEQFVQAVGVFPVGSLVELSTNEVAIVLAHNKVKRLEPRVLVLTWPDKTALDTPIERNLFDHPKGPDGKPIRILRSVAAGEYGIEVRDYYAADLARANNLI